LAIFLDSNAHVPLNKSALRAFAEFNGSMAAHGHAMSPSLPGRQSASLIETARTKIAELIGAKSPNQIIFTSSCTSACEWALEIAKKQNFKKYYLSPVEHSAVRTKFRDLFGISDLNANKDGVVACGFESPNTFMTCIYAQNEIGVIQPIETIKTPFFSDMSQALGKIPVNVSKYPNLKIAVFGAHKFGGPVSVGFMYLQDSSWWTEFGTGSRYFPDKTGTPDASLIVCASAALEESIKTLPERYYNMIKFRDVIESTVEELGMCVIGKGAQRLPNTSFIKVGDKMGPYLLSQLEQDGIFIGLGSACGGINMGPNPIMINLGYGNNSHDFIRISTFGEYSNRDAYTVAQAIKKYSPKKTDIQ
jgi:cysteine desulfurase